MKKFLFFLLLSVCSLTGFSQDADFSRIGFYPLVNPENISEAQKNWETEFSARLSSFGLVNMDQTRFVSALSITVDQEELAGSDMWIIEATATITIADIMTKQRYGSYQVEKLKGAGANKAKASKMLLQAFKNKVKSDDDFEAFLNSCKDKIIKYYTDNCDEIITLANTAAANRNFDEAITSLLSVPNVCTECFKKCQTLGIELNTKRLEFECASKISTARNLISGNDYEGAYQQLAGIDPLVSCYKDALELQKEIGKHWCSKALGEARGAWASQDAALASYYLSQVSSDSECANDAQKLANEMGANLEKWKEKDFELKKDEVTLEKLRIKAARDVSVEYARNQPKVVNNVLIASNPWLW